MGTCRSHVESVYTPFFEMSRRNAEFRFLKLGEFGEKGERIHVTASHSIKAFPLSRGHFYFSNTKPEMKIDRGSWIC